MVELWVLHIISQRQTFDQNLKKILPGVKAISSGHKIQGSNSQPWTVTLSLGPMAELRVLHIGSQVNIWPKFRENSSRGKGDTSGHEIQGSNLWPWTVTLTLCHHGWVMSSAHCLTGANIWPKFKENSSRGIGDMEWTRNSKAQTNDLDLWPWPWVDMVDLWVLHIDSLRQTFDQSLIKIFQRVQEIWSGQESVTEGQMDGRTDEGNFYNPPSALWQGINK